MSTTATARPNNPMHRRNFIIGSAAGIAAGLTGIIPAASITPPAAAPALSPQPTPADLRLLDAKAPKAASGLPSIRGLWLVNPHTQEEYRAVFWNHGNYDNPAYTGLCALMRDWRENVVMPMDPRLFHLLWAIQRSIDFQDPIFVNSGFRTLKTNEMLLSEGAAPNSQHIHSRASDITIAGIPPGEIAHRAQIFNIGGIGHYPNFTHLDVGPRREWRG